MKTPDSVACIGGTSRKDGLMRDENDFYATHPNATRLFLDNLYLKLKNPWECACGKGHIADVLREYGYTPRETDLIKRYDKAEQLDFLKCNDKYDGDIITNQPFKLAEAFLEKAMEILERGNCYIAFLKLQWLEGKARHKLFKKYPPKVIYVNSSRQVCAINGDFDKYHGNAVCYAWFIWQKCYNGDTIVRWLP